MSAPVLCAVCGKPIEGLRPDERAKYEAACARVGVPAAPATHPRRWTAGTRARYAQEAGCLAASAAEVARG